jgi:hypothetical protein
MNSGLAGDLGSEKRDAKERSIHQYSRKNNANDNMFAGK